MKIQYPEILELTKTDGGIYSVNSLDEAYNFCKKIAVGHYENFPVASILLPKKIRKYIYSIYAFARIADDIADELYTISIEQRSDYINKYDSIFDLYQSFINNYIENKNLIISNPIFIALFDTVNQKQIPISTLKKLLEAFRRDTTFSQAKSLKELEDYCEYSANPIGELILRLFNLYNNETAIYSNKICTGLQLANFWQDLSIDIKNNRCYIPENIFEKFNLTKQNLDNEQNSINLYNCLNELYKITSDYFVIGKELIRFLPYFRLRLEIIITVLGGELILYKTKKQGIKIINKRPKIHLSEIIIVFLKAIILSFKY